jgi:hypothetical protein
LLTPAIPGTYATIMNSFDSADQTRLQPVLGRWAINRDLLATPRLTTAASGLSVRMVQTSKDHNRPNRRLPIDHASMADPGNWVLCQCHPPTTGPIPQYSSARSKTDVQTLHDDASIGHRKGLISSSDASSATHKWYASPIVRTCRCLDAWEAKTQGAREALSRRLTTSAIPRGRKPAHVVSLAVKGAMRKLSVPCQAGTR